jgi:hypothetical protein
VGVQPADISNTEKLWNLKVQSVGYGYEVRLINHDNFTLRYTGPGGNVTASDKDFDAQLDYFRLLFKDGDFILLEPTSGKVFKLLALEIPLSLYLRV